MPRTVSTASRPPAPAPEEARWEAVLARDTAFDGDFYYSVATTGVYCRPSCPARRPKRAHVGFHDTTASAEAAGFRPCKRCKPDQPSATARHEAKVVQACRLIEAAEAPPSLQALADAVGLSPSHFHRLFRTATGVTPRAYACAHRNARVRAGLGKSATVTQAIYDAGFNSNGRFYATSADVLGMAPSIFRAGGADEETPIRRGHLLARLRARRHERQRRVRNSARRWARGAACGSAWTIPPRRDHRRR